MRDELPVIGSVAVVELIPLVDDAVPDDPVDVYVIVVTEVDTDPLEVLLETVSGGDELTEYVLDGLLPDG